MMRAHPRGFALLIVLWSVVLLALLGTGMTAAGRTDVQLAANIRRAAAAQAAADGGIAAAVFHLSDTPARAWAADGRLRAVPFDAFTLTVRILDENRKVNPNYVAPGLLAALLTAAGANPQQAAAIVQAVTEWHTPGTREAVVARYRAAGLPAAPDGGPFRAVDDIGLVLGMTPELMGRLRPYLSVYADGALDYAQADPVVQEAVRSQGGGAPAPGSGRPTVVDITSEARGADGSRFVRHAVVALGRDSAGRLFRVLQWDAGAGGP